MNNSLYLKRLVLDGFKKRQKYFVDRKSVYLKRLRVEYNLIDELGYTDYFLIVHDIVEWTKENGILGGIGRGSVCGSLVAYLLGITSVDPIKFDLIFERFMNPIRSKNDPPDIDLDFQASKREEIKQYISNRWGNVVTIGSFTRRFASSAIKDVAKVMELDFQELNRAIAQKMYKIDTLQMAYDEIDSFKKWVDKNEKHKECFRIAQGLEGLIRQRTKHPAGVVVTPRAIENYVPVYMSKSEVTTQWSDGFIKNRGLLKIDILGIAQLDIFKRVVDYVGKEIDILSICLEDIDILKDFSNGNVSTVFQFDTPHQRKILKELGVSEFNDLIVATAIARPGAVESGIMDVVIERKYSAYVDDFGKDINEILKESYGQPIYQEQIMKLANVAGDIPLADTEVLRGAINKLDREVIGKYEGVFLENSQKKGINKKVSENLWDMIQSAGAYIFNKSHATAYSLISYFCMYLKREYPIEYMAACLEYEGDSKKVPALIAECKRLGIKVNPASLNKSKEKFYTDGKEIYAGFMSIKHVGEKAAQEIVEHQPYRTKADFLEKVSGRRCNKRIVETLERVGFFSKHQNLNFDCKDKKPLDMIELYGCWIGDLPELDLDSELPNCSMCDLWENRYKVVPGSGNQIADVMFVGEAPGYHEDRRGIPFVGKSGKLLRDEWLPGLNLKSSDVWITNICKCAPKDEGGKIGKPTDEQIAVCSMWLEKEISFVNPKVIVSLGSYALKALSDENYISRVNGKTFEVVTQYLGERKDVTGFALYHPAFILYKKDVNIDKELEKLKEIIAKES